MLKNPTVSVFYTIEQAIKAYRKLSQHNISQVIDDITVDQCLVLMILNDGLVSSQKEIAELLFKDYASITRMIELMVKKDYLLRRINPKDRRKFDLQLSRKGIQALKLLTPQIKGNRQSALKGITMKEVMQLERTLGKIIANCKVNNVK